jgi:hypothetical protein
MCVNLNKALLICLCIIPLIVGCIIGFTFFLHEVRAQGDGIIVEDADYVSTLITEYSADLINVAKDVTPRIVLEYGDFNSKLDLKKSDGLNQAASIVSARIIVEYADFISPYSLQGSENLTQIATTVKPRIIVEYADFIFSTGLGPKPMEDNTPPVIENVYQQPLSDSVYPDDEVVVYANVSDDLSGVKQVILNYTTNNGTWFSIEMKRLEGSLYNATIPEFPYCTNVTYVIIAEDKANHTITTVDLGYTYQYHVIPEFPSFLIMPLFIIVTMLIAILYKRRQPP